MKIESFSTPPLMENLSRLAEYLDSTGEDEGAGLVREAIAALSPAPAAPVQSDGWPSTLTPELSEVLGMMNFSACPIAHAYRAAGFKIKERCEDEQAFVLHRFAGFAINHGTEWRKFASEDLKALRHLPTSPAPKE